MLSHYVIIKKANSRQHQQTCEREPIAIYIGAFVKVIICNIKNEVIHTFFDGIIENVDSIFLHIKFKFNLNVCFYH